MSCYTVVTLDTKIRAEAEDVRVALSAMGVTIQSFTGDAIFCADGMRVTRANKYAPWNIYDSSSFANNMATFRREVAASKAKREAIKQRYRVVSEKREGDKIVIRMKIMP